MIKKETQHNYHAKIETHDGFYMIGFSGNNIEEALNNTACYKKSPEQLQEYISESWEILPLTWQTLTIGDQFKYKDELRTVVSADGLGDNRFYIAKTGGRNHAFKYFADELEQNDDYTIIQPDFTTDTIEIEGKSYTVSEIKEALNR